jgi:hypothetical protein
MGSGGKNRHFNIVGIKEMEAYPGCLWKDVNDVYLNRTKG